MTMGFFSRGTNFLTNWKRGPKDRPPFEAAYVYLLALLVGYWLADLGTLYVRPSLLPSQPPPARPQRMAKSTYTDPSRFQTVKDRNIFNQDGKIAPALTADGSEIPLADQVPVPSQLPLKLQGTLVHANPKRSVATIMISSKNSALPFMADREIEGLARVMQIERRRVIIRNLNNNRLEFIEIPRETAVTFGVKNPTVAGEEVTRRGEFDFTMRRADILKYTANMGEVLQQARMVPNIVPGSGGKVDGFRFVAIQPGSIYEKLGFKPMDIIKRVNGEDVNSPTKAMELYQALKSESRLQLTVERNGREENFKYDIPD